MKHLYALITTHCNLSCPHCDIRTNSDDGYNEESFLNSLNDFDGTITLFGGEPFLYLNRLLKVLELDKINSISTNLLYMDTIVLNKLINKPINIATSWNYSRFNNMEYHMWLKNIERLHRANIPVKILITLTKDLIDSDIYYFINMISYWDREYGIDSILFEHLIDDNTSLEFNDQVDNWLCEVYKLWEDYKVSIKNEIIDKLDHWYCDCRDTYTLNPDGTIVTGCPHSSKIYMVNECLSCPQSNKCMPCRLQKYCTYPKRLAKLVKGD